MADVTTDVSKQIVLSDEGQQSVLIVSRALWAPGAKYAIYNCLLLLRLDYLSQGEDMVWHYLTPRINPN